MTIRIVLGVAVICWLIAAASLVEYSRQTFSAQCRQDAQEDVVSIQINVEFDCYTRPW